MKTNRNANKIADVFADDRINLIHLAQQTALLFTPSMTAKLHHFLRWHSHAVNGRLDETRPEISLDNYEEIG